LEALLQHRSALFVKVVGECESRGYLLAASVVPMVTLAPVASVALVAPVAPVVAVTPAVSSVVTASLIVISETLEDFPQLSAVFSVPFCTGRSQLHDMPGNLFSLTIAVAVHSVADRLTQSLDSVTDVLFVTAVLIIDTVVVLFIGAVIIRIVDPVTLTAGIGRTGVLLQIEHLMVRIPQF